MILTTKPHLITLFISLPGNELSAHIRLRPCSKNVLQSGILSRTQSLIITTRSCPESCPRRRTSMAAIPPLPRTHPTPRSNLLFTTLRIMEFYYIGVIISFSLLGSPDLGLLLSNEFHLRRGC